MKIPSPLIARFVETVRFPGRYDDSRGGHGLILNVHQAGNGWITRSWIQRLVIDNKPSPIGLGSFPVITLAMKRQKAVENTRAVAIGKHPQDNDAMIPTFAEAVEVVSWFNTYETNQAVCVSC